MIKLEETTMKKQYNQPEVTVTSIALQSSLLAGSAGGGNQMGISTTIPTDQQW